MSKTQKLPSNFVESLEVIQPKEIFGLLKKKEKRGGVLLKIIDEIHPSDLFCYLGARFGSPNGIQNFTRTDDSDNLIHWDWTLKHERGLLVFLGMNFRTEVQLTGISDLSNKVKDELVLQIKSDFSNYVTQIGQVRDRLENWVEFVNPYQRLNRTIDSLLLELDKLELHPEKDVLEIFDESLPEDELNKQWKETALRYRTGFGLCFGIRAMLPVMAEAYVNMLLFILMKPELKNDARLRNSVFRQPIDIRVKSLSINCIGFKQQPDFSNEPCKKYNSLINERNDLLHGNITIDKLKFNEVYFLGKVPIFKQYRSMWQRSLGVEIESVGLHNVLSEVEVVRNFLKYLETCLEDDMREGILYTLDSYELGQKKSDNKIGVLFPPHLADIRVEYSPKSNGKS